VYLLPDTRDITIQLESIQKRLWLRCVPVLSLFHQVWMSLLLSSDVAVHLLACAMLILAVFGTITHLLHRADRRDLPLGHAPGTLASAVAIGGNTGVSGMLSGAQDEKELESALQNKRFAIDPRRMKIVMDGEPGYESAAPSPDLRRRSMFGKLVLGAQPSSPTPASKRFSAMSARTAPKSPLTPMSATEMRPPRSA
jgi:hypothetical protein